MNDLALPALEARRVHYLLPDVRCAGCALKIEKALSDIPGVSGVNVNYSEKRLSFDAISDELAEAVAGQVTEMGYPAAADRGRAGLDQLADERKGLLSRLGVAGIGMMQVMMFALADYVAGPHGIEADYETLMRWASLVIATPVVFFSAMPFHKGMLRDLKNRSPGMDVPVSIAILSAWTLGVMNTLIGGGEVYFDSACMFTFFLLTGRYLEASARHSFHVEETLGEHLLPETARTSDHQVVPLDRVSDGLELMVAEGEIVAGDGVVISGAATIDESAFTGESDPVAHHSGSRVLAGTRLVDGEMIYQVTGERADWVISSLSELYRESAAYRPAFARLADAIARYFVVGVLCLATLAGTGWYLAGNENFFAIALSVLVVSCPCALSLATPVAYTIASTAVRKLGVLVGQGAFLERLAGIDVIVFDKTGTLTTGELELSDVTVVDANLNRAEALRIAASLNAGSLHPVALSLIEASRSTDPVTDRKFVAGSGVSGVVRGDHYQLGKPEFAGDLPAPDEFHNWVLLSRVVDHGVSAAVTPVAWFAFSDRLRDGADAAVRETAALLSSRGGHSVAFSGDTSGKGRSMLDQLGLDATMGMTPADKIDGIKQLQQQGHKVLMVGDGLNDAGAMAVADLSLAVNPVDAMVQSAADASLVSSDIGSLPRVMVYATRVNGIIRQNLSWALTYNLSVIPLALLGFVPPWVAALGMSASSLLVTLNALRLSRVKK